MAAWNPGDRVEHSTFGAGTVLECNDQHTVVHFDDRGRRTFASAVVVLAESTTPPPFHGRPLPPLSAQPRNSGNRSATDVGYVNTNQQTVIRATGREGSLPGQKVYVLRCGRCGAHYGANGCDIHVRRCPACMGGQAGLPY